MAVRRDCTSVSRRDCRRDSGVSAGDATSTGIFIAERLHLNYCEKGLLSVKLQAIFTNCRV